MENAQKIVEDAQDKELSWGTRIAYGLGDTSTNFAFGAMTILTFFYTDYVGIEPAMIGLIMLLSRCFDGISDVAMGFLVERTNSKWGKSRPWILWSSLPFAVSFILVFTVPEGSDVMQFVYIFITYNLCTTVFYTALNLPYGSLSAMMTRNSKERDMLSIVRMTLSPIGKLIAVSATFPLVKIFGNTQTAWVEVMTIWAIIALALALICFWKCEENVVIEAREKTQQLSVGKSLSLLLKNKYFYMTMVFWMMQCVIQMFTGSVLPYYCKYIFMNESLYSILFLAETITMIVVTITICPKLLKRFGKRDMSLYGIIAALIGHLIFFLNPLSFEWVLFSCVIRGICFAPIASVIFGFLGDVVEYGQWKFHVRQEGLIFSASSIGYKVGTGITAAIITSLLSYSGYVASTTGSAVQPQSVMDMLVLIYQYGLVVIYGILIVVLLMYKLDKQYPSIMRDLIAREAKGEL